MPLLRCGSLLLLFIAGTATAEEKWWFDVEVILFDRNQALTQLEEQFDYADNLEPYTAEYDLIGDVLSPDIRRIKQSLPRCDAPPSPLWQPQPDLETLLSDYRRWRAANSADAEVDTERSIPSTSQSNAGLAQAEQRIAALTSGSPPDSEPATDSDKTTPVDTDNTPPVDAPTVSDSEIAEYWLAFHSSQDATRVSVPDVRFCQPEPVWFQYEDGRWSQPQTINKVPMPTSVPIEPDGVLWPTATFAHLLPADARDMTALSQQIRRTRGLTRLLHTTWRQEVLFGRENAPTMRLFAGKNYADEFTLSGNQRAFTPEAETLQADGVSMTPATMLERLEKRLAAPQKIDFNVMMAADPDQSPSHTTALATGKTPPIWQLDGGIKVFLRYINRVPYLHIDSELFYRQPIPLDDQNSASSPDSSPPAYRLVSVPFSQLRRVISTQVHYFDHPLFGMIVEIRRYHQPEDDEEQQ